MSIKKKLHYLISGQLPDFVKAEYPQFVNFLEHYYKFLETQNQVHDVFLNAQKWNDIDDTLDVFIPYYRAQFSYDIPSDTITNNRRLIKYINQYYEGKGSETSTEMFFRFMFNDTASVAYPGDYILRASDGRWSRKKLIKVETTEFLDNNIFDVSGTVITLRYLEFIRGAGNFERTVTTRCFDVYETSRPNIYQLEVDINPEYEFPDFISVDATLAPSLGNHDTHVYVQYDGTTYGTITKQLTSVASVITSGSKFQRDESYFISETGVEGAYFAGQYTQFTEGPAAYVYETVQNNAVVRITNTLSTLAEQYFLEDYVLFGDYASAPTLGQLRKLSIIDTGERFAVRDDEGSPINTFTVDLFPNDTTGSASTVTFNTGLIYHAPGEFKDNAGFLSDIIKLQDNDYYQPYSYVVRTTVPLGRWKNTYLESTHPAGFKLFAELQLTDNLNAPVTVIDEFAQTSVFDLGLRVVEDTVTLSEVVAKTVTLAPFTDSVSTSDSLNATLTYLRDFTETVSSSDAVDSIDTELNKTDAVSTADALEYSLNKELSDSTILSDVATITTNLSVSDTLTVSDALSYDFNQQDDLTSDLDEDVSTSEIVALDVSKSTSDTVSTSDDLVKSVDSAFSDTISTSETTTFDTELSLTDTISITDSLRNDFNQENDATSDLQDDVSINDTTAFTFNNVFIDSQSNLDVTVFNIDKSLTDTQSTSETVVKDVASVLSDTQNNSDATSLVVDKSLSDTVSTSDSIDVLIVIPVDLTDSVSTTETVEKNLSIEFTDTVSTSDTLVRNFNQENDATSDLQEDIALTDSTSLEIEFVATTDTISLSDTNTIINTNKSATDTLTTSESIDEIWADSYFEDGEYSANAYVTGKYVGTEYTP